MSRRVVTVTAERGTNWWVLEAPEAGAVSQCKRLTQAADEMREAIAYQLGLEPDGFDIDVRVVLPEQYEREATAAAELRHVESFGNYLDIRIKVWVVTRRVLLPARHHIGNFSAWHLHAAVHGRVPILAEFFGLPAALRIFIFKGFAGVRNFFKSILVVAVLYFRHDKTVVAGCPAVKSASEEHRASIIVGCEKVKREHRMLCCRRNTANGRCGRIHKQEVR